MGDVVIRHLPVKEPETVSSCVYRSDVCAFDLTLLVSVRCLPRSRHEDLSQPLNADEGCTITGAASPPRVGRRSHAGSRLPDRALRRDGLLFGDRPHESDELTRDGGGNRVRMLAPRQHLPVAPTQAHLRAPGDVANGFRQMLLPGLDLFRHLGPMAIRLGRLDEGPPRMPVAGLRDAAEAAPVGAGILAWGEAEILHELGRALEAREV